MQCVTGTVSLADFGSHLAYFFVPSGKWATTRPEWLLEQLEAIDFTLPEYQPEALRIGRVRDGEADYDYNAISQLAFGNREFTADDADAYVVTIDWHGTPSYLIARGCRHPANIIKMDLLGFEAVTDVVAALDVDEIRAFLAQKLGPGIAADTLPQATGWRSILQRWLTGLRSTSD